MFVEFIDRPISGQFPEKHFGPMTPYASWVLFTSHDGSQWVGSFARGWEGYTTLIISMEGNAKAFIVTGGNGYFIDVTKQQLLNEDELSGIKTAIADSERKRVIFSDGPNLHYIDFAGKVSILYDNHFFDEIEFIEINDDKLYGRYWYYQKDSNPLVLEMNLVTNEVKDSFDDQSPNMEPIESDNSSIIEKIKNWFKTN